MENQYLDFMQTPQMMEALAKSSVSPADARHRCKEYAKMFSRNDEMMNNIFGMGYNSSPLQKTFSGYAETPLLSTQYFNASVASYVSSFAGYMSVEKDFDQPNGLFYWFDTLGVTDLRTVVPNLGADHLDDINTMGKFTASISTTTGKNDYITVTGRKIIPGSVRIKIEHADGTKAELIDNGQAKFMALPGIISDGEINYINGTVSFTLSNASIDGDKITVLGKEDTTGTPSNTNGASNSHANDKRFVAKMQQLGISTVPDMLMAEYNIAALGAIKKSTDSDMATYLFTRLREIYTKKINSTLIETLEDGYTGLTMQDDVDLRTASLSGMFSDYRSRVDLFDSFLINVESALATKAVKSCRVTAYIAGNQAANVFQKGKVIGAWEPNTKLTYINDLLGWYNGLPVLRSTDIKENTADNEATFYAITKTEDAQMAPLARAIYMPLTDTPTVGNYNNPTQMASGIYYQEGVKYMAPELVQRVTFKYGI